MTIKPFDEDKTALSYWFPKLEAAGLPVPRTKIIAMPRDAMEDIWLAFDGKEGAGALKEFADDVAAAAADFGEPFFLRTDHTSGKHSWIETCFVPSRSNVLQHIFNIAEFSEIASFMGMPYRNWIVREFLPTIPLGICPRYGDMPVCREFRFFVEDGTVKCWHPYWPLDSLSQGGAFDPLALYEAMCVTSDGDALAALAAAAGRAVPGAWSIDLLETKRGWYITDMAEAHKSFHWEDCKA